MKNVIVIGLFLFIVLVDSLQPPAFNSMCNIPYSRRINGAEGFLAEYQFNDQYVRPTQSPTVAKNTAGPFPPNPPPFTPFAEISDLILSNSSYRCANHAGLCINPAIRGQGWPAGTPIGDVSMREMASLFKQVPFELGMTVEIWFRKTVESLDTPVPFFALTNCEGPNPLITQTNSGGVSQAAWTLTDCNQGSTNIYDRPTRAYITDAIDLVGACFTTNQQRPNGVGGESTNQAVPWLGQSCTVGFKSQFFAAEAGNSYHPPSEANGDDKGLHYYVHTISPQAAYGCSSSETGPGPNSFSFCSRHKEFQFPGNRWLYSNFFDGFNSAIQSETYQSSSEAFSLFAESCIHSMFNMFSPDLDATSDDCVLNSFTDTTPGEICDPNLWQAQVRKPTSPCSDPPSAYTGSLGLKFGNWNPTSTSTQHQWHGEILYFAIHPNALSYSAVVNNWYAGPPNTPSLNSPVIINMAYCQLIVNFQFAITDYDIRTYSCRNNVLYGILLNIPSPSIGTLFINKSIPLASALLPYRFPAIQPNKQPTTFTFVLNSPVPVNSESFSISYNSDDSNGGGTYSVASTVTFNIPGDIIPTASNFVVTLPYCVVNSSTFTFKVSQPISTQCNTPLKVVITESLGYSLFEVISPTRLIPVNTFPFTTLATSTFMFQTSDPTQYGFGVTWEFHSTDGIKTSSNAFASVNIPAPTPPIVPVSTRVNVPGCTFISSTVTLLVQPSYSGRAGTCGQMTIQFTQPPIDQGTLYYQPTPSSSFVVVPSTPIAYSTQYVYRFQLPDPRLPVAYNSVVRYVVTDSNPTPALHSYGNMTFLMALITPIQQPGNFFISMKQCDLVSSIFFLPVNTNNSLYIPCPGGLNFTILNEPPFPTTQGTLTQSSTGLTGTFVAITTNVSTFPWNQRYQFVPPPFNSKNLTFTWTYRANTGFSEAPIPYSPTSVFTVFVDASDAPLPVATPVRTFNIQAGQYGIINVTGSQGGCPSQNRFSFLTSLIVTAHAGASPTQNGSLFFYDSTQPNNVGARVPSAGIVVQSVSGTVNGISGTYSSYVDPGPGLMLVYNAAFPTGSALNTNSNILGHDSFYFFLQNSQRISTAAGKIQITIINPLQGVSQVLTIQENAQNTPLILRGINVPTGTVGVITNLTGQGTILFHALPISYPFTIAFEPGADQTPPNLVYNPPVNVSGNALGVVHFYMSYPGGLRSPSSYSVTFNVLQVNQPPWFEITPLPPVHIVTDGRVSNVTQGTQQAFNVTLHSLEFPLMPYTLTVSVTSPSIFSMCCQGNIPYYRTVSGGNQNSSSLILYAQRDLLNSFMHPIGFTLQRLLGGLPIQRQYITFTINDNDPTGPLSSTFVIPVDVSH